MSRKQIAQTLRRAKARIEKGRWIQGDYVDKRDGVMCYCAMGAIQRSTTDFSKQNLAARVLAETLVEDPAFRRFKTGHAYDSSTVVEFNDRRGRTRDQVLKAFDRAIARLEAGETTLL